MIMGILIIEAMALYTLSSSVTKVSCAFPSELIKISTNLVLISL